MIKIDRTRTIAFNYMMIWIKKSAALMMRSFIQVIWYDQKRFLTLLFADMMREKLNHNYALNFKHLKEKHTKSGTLFLFHTIYGRWKLLSVFDSRSVCSLFSFSLDTSKLLLNRNKWRRKQSSDMVIKIQGCSRLRLMIRNLANKQNI